MKNIELKQFGLAELSHQETIEINGGGCKDCYDSSWPQGIFCTLRGVFNRVANAVKNHSMPYDSNGKINFL